MDTKKSVGIGVGGALLTGALATCPIVQMSVLGALGALGFLPFLERLRPILYVAAVGFGAMAVYGFVRVRRTRRAATLRAAGLGQPS
jgi:hypothetical protein